MISQHKTGFLFNVHANPVDLSDLFLSLFRVPEKESISKAVLQKSRGRSQLWAHSKEPLKQPLLKKVCAEPELRDLACQTFIDILSSSPSARQSLLTLREMKSCL